MKKTKYFFILILLFVLTVLSTNILAQDEIASVESGEAVTMQYQVCGVFQSDRTLWVFKPGEPDYVQSFQISEEAHNFDQLAVGDLITMTYYQTVVLSLNEPGEAPSEKDEKVLIRAEKGETPGGVAAMACPPKSAPIY